MRANCAFIYLQSCKYCSTFSPKLNASPNTEAGALNTVNYGNFFAWPAALGFECSAMVCRAATSNEHRRLRNEARMGDRLKPALEQNAPFRAAA